jgi:hypothetical protein
MKKFFAAMALFGLITCGTLSEGGKGVKYSTKRGAPSECIEIGEINIGQRLSFGAISFGQVKIRMRKRTLEKGGNDLVIDTIEQHFDVDERITYTGTGRAYRCPAP